MRSNHHTPGRGRNRTIDNLPSESYVGFDPTWGPIVDSLSAAIALLDSTGRIVAVNRSWRLSAIDSDSDSLSASSSVGSDYLALCDASLASSAPSIAAGLRQVAAGELDAFELVCPFDSLNGRRWFVVRAVPYSTGEGGWVVVSHQDITESQLDRERVLNQNTVLDHIDAAVHTENLEGTVIGWSAGAEHLYGWSAEEAIGRTTEELMLADVALVGGGGARAIDDGRWNGEVTLSRRDGSTFRAEARASVSQDPAGQPIAITCVVIDITERLQTQRDLEVARDHLRAVTDSIGEGMFTIDLDGRLTYMNPAAEHALGWTVEQTRDLVFDELIQSTKVRQCRLSLDRELVRIDDDVFRRAGGLPLPVAYTASPFATEDGAAGLVIVFQDITDRQAQSQRLEKEIEKLHWLRRVQEAIANDRFVLFEQPIVDVRDSSVVQRELLIRMRDAEDSAKVISPGLFLPVAEEYGLICDIDRWVIDQSARLAAGGLAVELNVSACSIADRRLIPYIEAALIRTGADPTMLVVEITETTLVSNDQQGRRFVERLHSLGCRVALDDFGTGYGGFKYLKQLPVDYLKIDIEFVRDLLSSVASRNLVEAIVTLSQRFGMKTVAEGVEDSATLELLSELGVDYAQGYHLGRPAPVEEIEAK